MTERTLFAFAAMAALLALVLALGWWIGSRRSRSIDAAAELARARTEAAEAREQLALALDASRLALWDFDVASGRIDLSETWSEILGLARAPTSSTALELAALIPESERATVAAAIGAALKGPESSYRVEHRVIAPGGRTLRIVSEGRVVSRTAQGRAVRMIGTSRDISERVQAESALRESEERFRGAMQSSPVGMSIASTDGRWLKVNPALCRIIGYSEKELLERTFQDVTHPEDRNIVPERLSELLAGRIDAYQLEKRYLHKAGHEVWVQVNVSLMRDPQGVPFLISQVMDVGERRRLQEQVEHLALHDPLTDLPNSRLLLDRLDHALAAAKRAKRPMGVLYIDLDGFKPVNDMHGHAAGDRVLKEFAARLTQVLREADSVARIGGDEFVAVLGEVAGETEAATAAGRVLAAVAAPFDLGGSAALLTASIGIALFPRHGEDGEALLQRADAAMYDAKRSGKNAYRFATEERA